MVQHIRNISIDIHHKEQRLQGTPLLPCAAYDCDIKQFFAHEIPCHWHEELELFHLIEGEVEIKIQDEVLKLTDGEGCFFNSGVIHAFTALGDAPCHYHSFVFDGSIIGGMPGSIFQQRYVKPILTCGRPFVHIRRKETDFFQHFHAAFQACIDEEEHYELFLRHHLTLALFQLQKSLTLTGVEPSPDHRSLRMKIMLQWLEEHLTHDLSIEELADAAHISTRECQRCFRNYLHCTPTAYLNRRRILRGAELLCTTNKSITEISLDCGFESHAYFTKLFHRIAGCTPQCYRQEKKNT